MERPSSTSSASSPAGNRSRRSDTETTRLDGAELRPQTLERPRQARFHGPPRDPERFGCFALRQLEEIACGNDLAVLVAERVQRREQDLAPLVGEDRRLRR